MKNQTLFNRGGDLEKSNPSFSKKFLFSLATVSVLSTCAEAKISGCGLSGNCGTITNNQTGKITVENSGNILIIEEEGSVKPSGVNDIAIEFKSNSSTTTFKNQGTVIGGNNKGSIVIGDGATITTFENSGTIGNEISKFGITVLGNKNKSTITNFHNSGTISAINEGIYLKKQL